MTADDSRPWRCSGTRGIKILVRLTPGASADSVDGVIETAEGPALKIRVCAQPEKGAANRALEKLLSRWLGVPKTAVQLVKGPKSRLKVVLVSGQLEELCAEIRARIDTLPSMKL